MHGLFYYLFLLQTIISNCIAVPPDYCLTPLNDSNCDMNPVPVFSYYKPGSRCELYLWRGCPSLNKFVDEYECSHICIGRLWHSMNNVGNQIEFGTPEYCLKVLNTSKCTEKMDLVYTYDPIEGICNLNVWYQCSTYNKFNDEATCYSACTGKKFEETDNTIKDPDWNAKLFDILNKDSLEEVYDIIDTIGNKDDKNKNDDDININQNTQSRTTIENPSNNNDKTEYVTTTSSSDDANINKENNKEDFYEYGSNNDKFQNNMPTVVTGTIDDIKVLPGTG